MKKIALLIISLSFCVSAFPQAGANDLDFAFSQLKGNGPASFANSLYQDGDNARQLTNRLNPLMQGVGEFNGYEIISRRFLSKRIERLIIVLYFERFPVYLRLDYYDTTKGRVCLPANVSKEASDILPYDLISTVGK